MSAPLPEALRARFQKLIEEGLSGRVPPLRLKLSPAPEARWGLAIRFTGQAKAGSQGRPRGKGKFDPHVAFLIELIDQDGDMTMPELVGALADATGVQAHPDAIGAIPAQAGVHVQKKSLAATERRRAKVREQRDHWFKHRLPAISTQPECVVFIDESSVKTNLPRKRGWSQRGERLVMGAPCGSRGTQTWIAGL